MIKLENDMTVKVSKLSAVEQPEVETSSQEEWCSHSPQYNNKTPYIGYWIIGELINLPEVGCQLRIYRRIRNDVEIPGYFITSKINNIEERKDCLIISTDNSIYKLEVFTN